MGGWQPDVGMVQMPTLEADIEAGYIHR